ncbi:hypothetical protein [Marilutibacter aestuarii]|uniref:Uncharacterized protein n=1 Tax=Marilutibacter aestuarii TaxID=1706195 RepID=A0A508AMS6_9GAMM|nr:hypothetical protein [Lysobacter aestuarii]TQD50777.1 hypothetical protein FKV25_03395 [Lysobacter aestuarii]
MQIETDAGGHERLFVEGATVGSLLRFLEPDIPHVWILGHRPETALRWFTATVPLDRGGRDFQGQVRQLEYDLQLRTDAFIAIASEFERHGIFLVQARNPMPDTLWLPRIAADRQDAILAANGAVLTLALPHSVETACVTCFEPGHLARILARIEARATP